jgi:methionine-rich copper-binding protein CopC
VAASVLGLAAPASAHSYLVDSTPLENETLTQQPGSVSVTMNEDLLGDSESLGFGMTVIDEAGTLYGDSGEGCWSVDGPTLSMPVLLGEPGTYSVAWQVVSADGHPVSGTYSFRWAPAAGVERARAEDQTPCVHNLLVPTRAASSAPGAEGDQAQAADSTFAWVAGTLGLLVVAVVVTLLVARPREKRKPE